MPDVISNDGTVTRPEYGQGHKTVNMTVTITKGIELLSTESTKISLQIDNNKLVITPLTGMATGINRLRIPAGVITDMSGNAFEEFELTRHTIYPLLQIRRTTLQIAATPIIQPICLLQKGLAYQAA